MTEITLLAGMWFIFGLIFLSIGIGAGDPLFLFGGGTLWILSGAVGYASHVKGKGK